jgi:glutamine synthetase
MSKKTKASILKEANEANVKYVRLCFTDINGVINFLAGIRFPDDTES